MHSTIESRNDHAAAQSAVWRLAEAQERVLQDIDTYTDWLYGECMETGPVVLTHIPEEGSELLLYVDGLTTPQLQALTLYPRRDASFAASQRLSSLYLSAQADHIRKLADEVVL